MRFGFVCCHATPDCVGVRVFKLVRDFFDNFLLARSA
jgi:hypothetical protein